MQCTDEHLRITRPEGAEMCDEERNEKKEGLELSAANKHTDRSTNDVRGGGRRRELRLKTHNTPIPNNPTILD